MSKQEKGIQYLKVNLVILKSKNNTTRKEVGMGLGGQKIRNYDCWAEEWGTVEDIKSHLALKDQRINFP